MQFNQTPGRWLRGWMLLTLCGCALLVPAPRSTAVEADPFFLTTTSPALKQLPAPVWVNPGAQLGYSSSVANLRSGLPLCAADPGGGWVDARGCRFRHCGPIGGSAQGVTVVTVVAVDGKNAVAQVENSIVTSCGALAPSGGSAVISDAGACETWIAPEGLKQLTALNAPDANVMRGPFTIQGRTYAGVLVHWVSDGASQYCIYDEASGVLLQSGSESLVAGPILPNGTFCEPHTVLTVSSFLGLRNVAYSWTGQAAPDWVGKFRALRYRGHVSTTIAYTSAEVLTPLTSVVLRGRSGSNWIETLVHATLNNAGGFETETDLRGVAGPGEMHSLFVPPASLQKLKQGEELDRDPFTGYVYSVMGQARGERGPVLVIREQGRAHTMDVAYDLETGMMQSALKVDRSLAPATTTTEIHLTSRE